MTNDPLERYFGKKVPVIGTYWLVEKRPTPSNGIKLYIKDGYFDWTNDVYKAERFKTEKEAEEHRLFMVPPFQFNEMVVKEHKFCKRDNLMEREPPWKAQK